MANHTIYLTLSGSVLKWSPDGQNNWKAVSEDSPSTIVRRNDEIDWISNDDTISKVKVVFSKTDIFTRINDNDSKKPKGKVRSDSAANTKDKYEIWIKTGDASKGYLKFDPEVKVSDPPG